MPTCPLTSIDFSSHNRQEREINFIALCNKNIYKQYKGLISLLLIAINIFRAKSTLTWNFQFGCGTFRQWSVVLWCGPKILQGCCITLDWAMNISFLNSNFRNMLPFFLWTPCCWSLNIFRDTLYGESCDYYDWQHGTWHVWR